MIRFGTGGWRTVIGGESSGGLTVKGHINGKDILCGWL